MSDTKAAASIRTGIVPCFVYENAPAAIDFLCAAFGFERQLVVPGATPGDVAHAQLVLDGSMIMLGSAKPAARERFGLVTPRVTNNLVTSCTCVTLADPDAHCARAQAAGAEIIAPPHDNPFGGRGYEARDLEGNVWNFSSFDPWGG